MRNDKWFDFAKEALSIHDRLGPEYADWKAQIYNAIQFGSTGGEILSALRGAMGRILKSESSSPEDTQALVRDFIRKADILLY